MGAKVDVQDAGADAGGNDSSASADLPDGGADGESCLEASDCPLPAGLSACERVVCVASRCGRALRETGSACDDGDRCTVGTRCQGEICGGGSSLVCADDNPCTADLCDPLVGCRFTAREDGALCTDADPCTTGDRCAAGACGGDPDPACACASDEDCADFESDDLCRGELTCVEGHCRLSAESVVACDPPGPCRLAGCDPTTGACEVWMAPDGAACDDGNPCSDDDRCHAGQCSGSVGGCACAVDADCSPFVGAAYDLCKGPLRCIQGACAPDPSGAVVCSGTSGESCRTESCDPSTGLCGTVALADGAPCATDLPCAPSGQCVRGACVAPPNECDDANPCTDDACAGADGCTHTARTGACDDGDPCTSKDTCQGGLCVGGPPPICDDLEPCTVDACDPQAGGCVSSPLPDGQACQGADLCLGGGSCLAGTCQGAAPLICPPAGPCAQALCKPDLGCTVKTLADGTPCDDSDACTQAGTCYAGACEALPVSCKDGNPCTVDACDPSAGGCTHQPAPDGTGCPPANPCLEGGQCQGGQCAGGQPVVCPAAPCTLAVCDPATGACLPAGPSPDGLPCDAGLCADGGVCSKGSCKPEGPVDCEDEDACTLDSCDPKTGACVHAPRACPEPAGDACQDASCAPATGCASKASPLCSDGLVLLSSSFPCEEPSGWKLSGAETEALSFAIDAPLAPGASWDGDCSLAAWVPANTPGPWLLEASAALAASPPAGPQQVRVSFVERWESALGPQAPTRSLALLAGGSVAAESALPPLAPEQPGDWQPRQLVLSLPAGANADALRIAMSGGSAMFPTRWRIDKLVVVALESPAP
ncbi:MAG: hypothetical protein H6744_04615 [Deltaproteobacteria bacterium]|nr:hypothetical protein [Deltaproteobacteria bacterium]